MALYPRIRTRAVTLFLRDILRTGLNAQITAAIAEAGGVGEPAASGLAIIADTTAQIELGDHPDYEPIVYPSIRISNPIIRYVPFTSATVTDAEITYLLGVYVQEAAYSGECSGDVVKTLSETALDLLESIRACIEEDYAGTTYGERVLVVGFERVEAPQDPEAPCLMRLKYEMTVQSMTRVRQSRGATT